MVLGGTAQGNQIAPTVVILSKNAHNLKACVAAVRQYEPAMRIIVVDDGASDGAKDLPVEWVPGKKPFVFARNANIGIMACESDVILLNDDALLATPSGFTQLWELAIAYPEYGILAASTDSAGNPAQHNLSHSPFAIREELRMVCFIAVLIKRALIQQIGGLDEELIGYGFDDDAYCLLARKAGWKIGIVDRCFVSHTQLPSTFRHQSNVETIMATNLMIYEQKYGPHPLVPTEWRKRIASMKKKAT